MALHKKIILILFAKEKTLGIIKKLRFIHTEEPLLSSKFVAKWQEGTVGYNAHGFNAKGSMTGIGQSGNYWPR